MNSYILTYTTHEGKYVRFETHERHIALSAFRKAHDDGGRNLWLVYKTPITGETIMASPGRKPE